MYLIPTSCLLLIASYEHRLLLTCKQLYIFRHKIHCKLHHEQNIYINNPCKRCGFVCSLTDDRYFHVWNEYLKRKKKFNHFINIKKRKITSIN